MLMMLASGSLDLLSKHMIQGFYEVLQAFYKYLGACGRFYKCSMNRCCGDSERRQREKHGQLMRMMLGQVAVRWERQDS